MTPRLAWVTFVTAVRKGAGERGGMLLSVGFYVIVAAVLGSLWRTAVSVHGGAIEGYGAVALTWYVATSEAAAIPVNARLIEDIGAAISGGAVTVEMLRPASVLGLRVVTELGRALPRLGACMLGGILLCLMTGGAPVRPAALALAAPSLVLAIACNVAAMHAFAGGGFWLRDTRSAWFLYMKLVFLLGGLLIPLELLPPSVEAVARALPFMAMAYAPARLASGHVEPSLLLVQAGWFVALAALAAYVFAAGERRLQAVGG
jgi:ABC-2 type transport system permease protein